MRTRSEIGVPVVFPSNTPDRISTNQLHFFLLYICSAPVCGGQEISESVLRKRKSGRTSVYHDTDSGTMDSPHVVIRKILPNDEPLIIIDVLLSEIVHKNNYIGRYLLLTSVSFDR